MRRKDRQRQGSCITFAQVLLDERDCMNRVLFQRAGDASRLAKALRHENQRLAYSIKSRCLRQLIERGGVLAGVDHWRSPGLLSVSLGHGYRLHTHENWLYPERTFRRAY